jgi:hypothetical protein
MSSHFPVVGIQPSFMVSGGWFLVQGSEIPAVCFYSSQNCKEHGENLEKGNMSSCRIITIASYFFMPFWGEIAREIPCLGNSADFRAWGKSPVGEISK